MAASCNHPGFDLKNRDQGKAAPCLLGPRRKGNKMTDQNSAAGGADNDLIDLSADIVCAYVSHNALSVTDLPKLIADVHVAERLAGRLRR